MKDTNYENQLNKRLLTIIYTVFQKNADLFYFAVVFTNIDRFS